MFHYTSHHILMNILKSNHPQALAWINGNSAHPNLNGMVKFYSIPYDGILIEAEIFNLPDSPNGDTSAFFGFHIHAQGNCQDDFSQTGAHYDAAQSLHPFHSGDFPPLMSNQGYAWTVFYDTRLTIPQVLEKSIVIHRDADDFTAQPAGNSGEKIACGIIRPLESS